VPGGSPVAPLTWMLCPQVTVPRFFAAHENDG